LGQKVRAKYPGVYDDMTDLEVGRRTLAKYPEAYADFGGADSGRIPVRTHERNRPKRKDKLPMAADIGGGIGGLLGHPGAALGGAIGSTVNRLATDIPAAIQTGEGVNPMDVLGDVVKDAGEQAALNWAGGAVGRGVGKVAKPLMSAALKAAPEVAQIAIREGIAATRAGAAKLGSRIKDISRETRLAVAHAQRAGARLDTNMLASKIEADVLADLGQSSTSANKIPEVNKIKQRFLGSGGTIQPVKAHQYFKSANKAAEPQFVKSANGQMMMLPSDPVEQLWKMHEAKHIGEALTNATRYAGPGGAQGSKFAELNGKMHELLKLKEVMDLDDVGLGARLAQQGTSRAAAAATGATRGAAAPGNRGQNAAVGAVAG